MSPNFFLVGPGTHPYQNQLKSASYKFFFQADWMFSFHWASLIKQFDVHVGSIGICKIDTVVKTVCM